MITDLGHLDGFVLPGNQKIYEKTDNIASRVLEELAKTAPNEIQQQMQDNIKWIKGAQENNPVVGSQARILYADAEGRIKIAEAFNQAIAKGEIGTVVLGRDHHDVSGTDSPYRETSNIYDGSRFTADMAIQNVIGDSFRGATWVSIHNGGGVGWGEVINGGFGMVLDGSKEASLPVDQETVNRRIDDFIQLRAARVDIGGLLRGATSKDGIRSLRVLDAKPNVPEKQVVYGVNSNIEDYLGSCAGFSPM